MEYLKKQFYRLVNYHGNILILENLTHEYLQLLEYFKDFLAYNNSIMLNFDCLSRRDDNSLYFFMLAAYLKYLAEHNVRPKKIKKIVQKKFPAETAKLILFAPELRSLFGNTTIKPRFTAARQNRPSPAAEFIELLRDFCTRKNSMALVLRNIQHIDEMSKKLLFYTDRHLNSLPVLILGILS